MESGGGGTVRLSTASVMLTRIQEMMWRQMRRARDDEDEAAEA